MSKGTSIKDAITKWETKNEKKVSEATIVKLLFQLPPIDKMDAGMASLSHVTQLSLSTNAIDKISGLTGFNNLKVLSLGRNNIKSLAGLEPVGDTLEELWMSYNGIEKLKGCAVLRKLKVFYLSNNKVKDWKEFDELKLMDSLEDLLMVGNPLQVANDADGAFLKEVTARLPKLKKLDGIPIVRAE